MDKVLKNEEIKDMINAFGCGVGEGYGNDFDINKLRYNKIIIMSDADEVKAKLFQRPLYQKWCSENLVNCWEPLKTN